MKQKKFKVCFCVFVLDNRCFFQGTVLHFANVARSSQIAYCYTVIERNNRLAVLSRSNEKLDPFFPFDEFALPHTRNRIADIHREYNETSVSNGALLAGQTEERLRKRSECSDKMEEESWDYSTSPGFSTFLLKDPDLVGD